MILFIIRIRADFYKRAQYLAHHNSSKSMQSKLDVCQTVTVHYGKDCTQTGRTPVQNDKIKVGVILNHLAVLCKTCRLNCMHCLNKFGCMFVLSARENNARWLGRTPHAPVLRDFLYGRGGDAKLKMILRRFWWYTEWVKGYAHLRVHLM